jgi:hypothetical protein
MRVTPEADEHIHEEQCPPGEHRQHHPVDDDNDHTDGMEMIVVVVWKNALMTVPMPVRNT